jgi:hypothetical protein
MDSNVLLITAFWMPWSRVSYLETTRGELDEVEVIERRCPRPQAGDSSVWIRHDNLNRRQLLSCDILELNHQYQYQQWRIHDAHVRLPRRYGIMELTYSSIAPGERVVLAI